MSTLQRSYAGLRLLARLNVDLMISAGLLGAGLLLGAYLTNLLF